MTLDEFREKLDRFWESANREALELKDSYLALERLHSLYRSLGSSARELADQVLAEWVLTDEEAKRFDAVALIREFEIVSAVPAQRQLADELRRSDDPGAPFERDKVGTADWAGCELRLAAHAFLPGGNRSSRAVSPQRTLTLNPE